MGITDDIINAIDSSPPMKINDNVLMVGIGDIQKLNSLTQLPGTQWYLWELLEYGTGTYRPGGQEIIRRGRQIFYDRDGSGQGILTHQTVNPGFEGRHAFMTVTGDFYDDQLMSIEFIMDYINHWVKTLSWK
jgi:hypothetical protein